MGDFEWALTRAFNQFFEEEGIEALAYRLKQSRFAPQLIDILVDSRHSKYYLAVECKSLDARKNSSLYFKSHFSATGGGHQLERETKFLELSGRTGVLAVELRRGAGRPRSAYLLPWGLARERFDEGFAGLRLEKMESYPALERKGGNYHISQLDLAQITRPWENGREEGEFTSFDFEQGDLD